MGNDFINYATYEIMTYYCKSGNFRKVEIFAAKWSGAKIKPREYYVKMRVFACASLLSAKLKTCEIHLSRLGAKN